MLPRPTTLVLLSETDYIDQAVQKLVGGSANFELLLSGKWGSLPCLSLGFDARWNNVKSHVALIQISSEACTVLIRTLKWSNPEIMLPQSLAQLILCPKINKVGFNLTKMIQSRFSYSFSLKWSKRDSSFVDLSEMPAFSKIEPPLKTQHDLARYVLNYRPQGDSLVREPQPIRDYESAVLSEDLVQTCAESPMILLRCYWELEKLSLTCNQMEAQLNLALTKLPETGYSCEISPISSPSTDFKSDSFETNSDSHSNPDISSILKEEITEQKLSTPQPKVPLKQQWEKFLSSIPNFACEKIPEITDIFSKELVRLEDLPSFNDAELKELGVAPFGLRRAILNSVGAVPVHGTATVLHPMAQSIEELKNEIRELKVQRRGGDAACSTDNLDKSGAHPSEMDELRMQITSLQQGNQDLKKRNMELKNDNSAQKRENSRILLELDAARKLLESAGILAKSPTPALKGTEHAPDSDDPDRPNGKKPADTKGQKIEALSRKSSNESSPLIRKKGVAEPKKSSQDSLLGSPTSKKSAAVRERTSKTSRAFRTSNPEIPARSVFERTLSLDTANSTSTKGSANSIGPSPQQEDRSTSTKTSSASNNSEPPFLEPSPLQDFRGTLPSNITNLNTASSPKSNLISSLNQQQQSHIQQSHVQQAHHQQAPLHVQHSHVQQSHYQQTPSHVQPQHMQQSQQQLHVQQQLHYQPQQQQQQQQQQQKQHQFPQQNHYQQQQEFRSPLIGPLNTNSESPRGPALGTHAAEPVEQNNDWPQFEEIVPPFFKD